LFRGDALFRASVSFRSDKSGKNGLRKKKGKNEENDGKLGLRKACDAVLLVVDRAFTPDSQEEAGAATGDRNL